MTNSYMVDNPEEVEFKIDKVLSYVLLTLIAIDFMEIIFVFLKLKKTNKKKKETKRKEIRR